MRRAGKVLSEGPADSGGAAFGKLTLCAGEIGPTFANIPSMLAIGTMNPDMSSRQWMVVAPSTGVGGSLVSIGTAAGVVSIGLVRNPYTFMDGMGGPG